jgi:hypothetical protein
LITTSLRVSDLIMLPLEMASAGIARLRMIFSSVKNPPPEVVSMFWR